MAESFTIQISNNLVDQILKDENKRKKKTKKPKPKTSEKPKPKTSEQLQQASEKIEAVSAAPKRSASGWPLQPPMFLPAVPSPPPPVVPELEGIRSVLMESERVLDKLEKQEANMTQELTQRAKELRDKEFKLPYQNPLPCTVERGSCLQCYKENIKDPLKCAQAVRNFADCARRARQQVNGTVNE